MKIKILLVALVLIGFQSVSQIAPDKYYIQFTDKNDSPYSLNNPEEFLTQRALDRREKHGIGIYKNDLPVNQKYLTGVKNKGVTLLNATRWLNGVTIETDDPSLLDLIDNLPYVEEIYKFPDCKRGTRRTFLNLKKLKNQLFLTSCKKTNRHLFIIMVMLRRKSIK